jgi:hypothetical protein
VAVDLAVPEGIDGTLERIAEIVNAFFDLLLEVDLRAAAGIDLPVETHHELGHGPGALAGGGVFPEQRFVRQLDPNLPGERFGLQDHFVGELLMEEQEASFSRRSAGSSMFRWRIRSGRNIRTG